MLARDALAGRKVAMLRGIGRWLVKVENLGGVRVETPDIPQIRFAVLVDFSDGDSVNILAQPLLEEFLFFAVGIGRIRLQLLFGSWW